MRGREAERLAAERLELLEMEASLQRAALAATFAEWEQRRALVWGGMLAKWGFRLLATPQLRWMIATRLLSRIARRRTR